MVTGMITRGGPAGNNECEPPRRSRGGEGNREVGGVLLLLDVNPVAGQELVVRLRPALPGDADPIDREDILPPTGFAEQFDPDVGRLRGQPGDVRDRVADGL